MRFMKRLWYEVQENPEWKLYNRANGLFVNTFRTEPL